MPALEQIQCSHPGPLSPSIPTVSEFAPEPSEVASDISNKLQAKPDENKETDTPNLYGANLHVYRKATWLTHELYALLEDEEGLADGQLHFSAITRAEYDTWTRAHSKKGALD